jgi:hypothetical protein
MTKRTLRRIDATLEGEDRLGGAARASERERADAALSGTVQPGLCMEEQLQDRAARVDSGAGKPEDDRKEREIEGCTPRTTS